VIVPDPSEFDDKEPGDWRLELDSSGPSSRPPEILTLSNLTEAEAHRSAGAISTRRYSLDRLMGIRSASKDGSPT